MKSWSERPRWQRNALITFLFLAAFVVYNCFGFPMIWRQVRPGMTMPEVDALCGPPDYYNGITKPDMWFVKQPFGQWDLRVSIREDTRNRDTDVVRKTVVHFRPFWNKADRYIVYWNE